MSATSWYHIGCYTWFQHMAFRETFMIQTTPEVWSQQATLKTLSLLHAKALKGVKMEHIQLIQKTRRVTLKGFKR